MRNTPLDPVPGLSTVLLAHFDDHRRDLPWRRTSDPYAIWVSEVMLQQTRVETVVPYYRRWMARFPTVDALAEAELDDVLREWQGLGYYSRARNLHRAARMVRELHGGEVPDDAATLRRLPGVGEYTAGAVASIAHGEVAPAVDGNVRRVLARLFDLPRPTAAELRERVTPLIPLDRPGDFNQALMELGATICTPRSPSCDACPMAPWCRARERGVQEARPLPKKARPIPEETVETAVVVRSDAAALLVRRPESGLLGGMWEFPGDDASPAVVGLIRRADPIRDLAPVPHVFSHKRVTYLPTLLRAAPGDDGADGAGPDLDRDLGLDAAWAPLTELDRFALPVAQQKIAARARDAWGEGAGSV